MLEDTEERETEGGEDGEEGDDGDEGDEAAGAGRDGKDGHVVFRIVEASGACRSYDAVFDVALQGYAFRVAGADDGVVEPGETLVLEALDVANVGGMPTPPGATSAVRLVPESGLQLLVSEKELTVLVGVSRCISGTE